MASSRVYSEGEGKESPTGSCVARKKGNRFSACSKAITLAEIVSLILGFAHIDYLETAERTIFACLLVNRLWNYEGLRFFWNTCGGDRKDLWRIASMGPFHTVSRRNCVISRQLSPGILQLVRLRPSIQQHTATQIETLVFSRERITNLPWDVDYYVGKNLGLPFGCLETLYVGGTDLPSGVATFLSFCPALKNLHIGDCTITHPLMHALATSCKGLETLRLYSTDRRLLVPNSLMGVFLRDLKHLATFKIGQLDKISSDLFLSLARHEAIRDLYLPGFQTAWVDTLELTEQPRSAFFPLLKTLRIKLTDSMLIAFATLPLTVSHLYITMHSPRKSLLRIPLLAALSKLITLNVSIPGSNILVSDLIALARDASLLRAFELQGVNRCYGLNNDTFAQLMAYLPNLNVFKFGLTFSPLDTASLVAIADYCKELQSCKVNASVDFDSLIVQLESDSWTELKALMVFATDGGIILHKTPGTIAYRIRHCITSLRSLQVNDNALTSAFKHSLKDAAARGILSKEKSEIV